MRIATCCASALRMSGRPSVVKTVPHSDSIIAGAITRIGLEVERQSILAANPAANTDARIVRITVQLDPTSSPRAAALTGLEVTGNIATGPTE